MRYRNDTKGFALPAAIGALVIVGVLVTAGFYMARQELRIGVASQNATLAVNLAQSAANDILVNDTRALSKLAVWGDTTLVDTLDQGVVTIQATRLALRLFYLDATAEVTQGGLYAGATRRMGLVTRMTTAGIDPPAALTTQGAVKYGGSSEIHGMDEAPDGSGGMADWGGYCDTSPVNKPGLMTNDTSQITWNGNRNKIEGNMSGTPKFTEDPSITAESLTTFGDLDWYDMAALADKTLSTAPSVGPVVTGGVCNTAPLGNWGAPTDPTSPCFDYFPIIYVSGDLQLTSGAGQGILLVEGDLKVTGGFEFYGPVYVRGTLTTMGSGGHFWGGVTAANADLDTNTVLGNAVITYSSCAIQRAILNNPSLTRVRPLAMRSWVDLSNVTGG